MKLLRLILLYPILNIITLTPCLSLNPYTISLDGIAGCKGRLKLNGTSGFITSGPSYYSINLQCIWLIDSGTENATITIQVHRFNTECNYDYLYVFDGDSIYSPMVVALSGDIKDFNTNYVNNYDKFSGSNKISYQPRAESVSQNNIIKNHNINVSDNSGSPIGTTLSTTSLNNKNTDNTSSIIGPTINQYGRTISSLLTWHPTLQSEPFEIKTYSGKAFIYFHSDTAQSMPGFHLTYNVNSMSCPDCNDHGLCVKETLTCKCSPGYHGNQCQHMDCPNNCTSSKHGLCNDEKNCLCNDGFQGLDCSSMTKVQSWTNLDRQQQIQSLNMNHSRIAGRAQHQTVIIENQLWVIGGKTRLTSDTNLTIFKKRKSSMIRNFDLDEKKWSNITIEGTVGVDHLAELTGHASVGHGQKIYTYGGLALNYTILDSMTVFDSRTLISTTITANKDLKAGDKLVSPIASVGHSANIINDDMYIFLGFNPTLGYLSYVQRYNVKNGNWSLIERKGSPLSGCIGHTTTYDPSSELVYLYGGHDAQRLRNLYSFDPKTEMWTLLQPGPSPRYYHSAVILDRQLIILGGNSYNNSFSIDQCFQDSYLIYDLNCNNNNNNNNNNNINNQNNIKNPKESISIDAEFSLLKSTSMSTTGSHFEESVCEPSCWTQLKNTNQPGILKAHGHSVVDYKRQLILHGGFNGLLLNELLIMPIGNCSSISDEIDCNRQKLVIDCSWNVFDSKCENKSDMLVNSSSVALLHNSDYNSSPTTTTTNNCVRYSESDVLSQSIPEIMEESPCIKRSSCNECVSSRCIWCSSSEQCIDPTAYFAYHPIGQCMHYVAHPNKCVVASCSDIESCDMCLANPKCGWLNDIGNTGKGKCLEGTMIGPLFGNLPDEYDYGSSASNSIKAFNASYNGPSMSSSGTSMISRLLSSISSSSSSSTTNSPLLSQQSPAAATTTTTTTTPTALFSQQQNFPNWFYTSCPACQCNGHSYCKSNSSICAQPCQDNTEGHQCERCISGFFGDPLNGNVCKPCKCNGHAQTCNKETGKCYCHTKGIIGHQCHRCDEQNHYVGDPINPNQNGTCYYNLTTDFQYTFNMSKPEDHYYSDINFINVPIRREADVDFTITCSKPALVNITSGHDNKYRRPLFTERECGTIRLRLSPDRNDLMQDYNFSYFVHVHKFQTPFVFQISFSQHRTIYLPQVFFTFSSCFLFFFILSGVLWKLKIEYDNYARRQRQTIELQQMASRPFSRIFLELFETSSWKSGMTKVPTSDPTPISFEPCFGDNIGVLSVFVQLPGGRPNLAVGSALVNLTDPVEDQVSSTQSSNNTNAISNQNQPMPTTTTTSRDNSISESIDISSQDKAIQSKESDVVEPAKEEQQNQTFV